jgi:hypothetical protein
MKQKLSELRVFLPEHNSTPMLKLAYNNAKNSGIPEALLKRKFVVINNFNDFPLDDVVNLNELPKTSQLLLFTIALRFSLPDALFKRYNFLTSKMYTSQIDVDSITEYAYYVVASLYSDKSKYDFLEKEIFDIEQQIIETGTYTTSRSDFSAFRQVGGTFADHLIACNFLLGMNESFMLKPCVENNMVPQSELHDVIGIINHLPIISQFYARNRYIASPSVKYDSDWKRFILAGENLLSVVFNIYRSLNKDYWKAYYFFVNNDICDIAKVTTFSEIDEEAVDNWVKIPKSFLNNDEGNYVTVDNLNYLKWEDASRY